LSKLYGGDVTTAKFPETEREWQDAVDAAQFLLALEAAMLYRLIDVTDVQMDTARCERILVLGRGLGYKPRPIAELVQTFMKGECKP
jgi:hypothetical protein